MRVLIEHQSSYSRMELLLRSFFGWVYILIPHLVLQVFYSVWVTILQIYAWFAILITTKYPKVAFDSYVGLLRWQVRLNASLMNLVDGYPPFGPSTKWEKADLEVKYPEVVTRKRLIFISFLGSLVLIPQIIVLYFVQIAASIASIFAWFAVLFTGKYPVGVHKFLTGSLRLGVRVTLYASYLYFRYPEFSLEETQVDLDHLK